MSLTLYVAPEWYEHLQRMEQVYPGYVPVIKGNGYGFGHEFLAAVARRLGKEQVAVGTVHEARLIQNAYPSGTIIVLVPTLAPMTASDLSPRLVFTVGSLAHLQALVEGAGTLPVPDGEVPALRVLIKCRSGMHRFGVTRDEMRRLREAVGELHRSARLRVQVEGFALHFPRQGMEEAGIRAEIAGWIEAIRALDWPVDKLYVSHLSPALYQELGIRYPGTRLVMRLGMDLWVYQPALFFRSKVLDIREVRRGERFGYTQRRARRNMRLLYVSGGTAHGIGLDPPPAPDGWGARLLRTLSWFLGPRQRHLSPFYYEGERLRFAEPPHMQVSILELPPGARVPRIGEEIPVAVRVSTVRVDHLQELPPRPKP